MYIVVSSNYEVKVRGGACPYYRSQFLADFSSSDFLKNPGYYIKGYNDKTLNGISVDSCKAACIAETAFICISFDYDKSN